MEASNNVAAASASRERTHAVTRGAWRSRGDGTTTARSLHRLREHEVETLAQHHRDEQRAFIG